MYEVNVEQVERRDTVRTECVGKWLPTFLVGAIGALGLSVLPGAPMPSVAAQSAADKTPAAEPGIPQWQIDAGGKMEFDVASVKLSKPGDEGYRENFALTLGPNMRPIGNLMSVNVPLRVLIGFAFKISGGQTRLLMPGLPSWVDSEWFDIEARAAGNPTKDQFRLMMQSLLAERFKLATHRETRQVPIFAMVLAQPGKTGPQLTQHTDDSMCVDTSLDSLRTPNAGLPPFACGFIIFPGLLPSVPGRMKGGGRALSMDYIAAFLSGFQGLDRPVVNRTGLTGLFDFWIELVPQSNAAMPSDEEPDPGGPTVLEALHEQLGLKLEPTTGPVGVLVVDHIEEPSPN
jgi:uncharacterized protein (TIGR03435 family)